MDGLAEAFEPGMLDRVVSQTVEDRFEWVLDEMAQSTRDDLQALIVEGLDEGTSPRRIAQKMRGRFDDDFATWRADRIARTEMLAASNSGTWSAHRSSSAVEFRSWLSTRDTNVRPAHVTLDQRTQIKPIPVDRPFEIDGDQAMYPGDFSRADLVVNCRCTTVAEFPDRRRTTAEREKLWRRFVKRLDEQEERTKEVVQRGFARQRDRVLGAFADAFDIQLEVVA